MERRVIIQSFHSQVCITLSELGEEPDLIVALDSHLDVFIGTKEVLDLMPKRVQLAATRASAHTLIRRALGDIPMLLKAQGLPTDFLPEMTLVVPRISLNEYILEQADKIQDIILSGALEPNQLRENPMDTYLSFLSECLGIKVYTSPPNNLMKLADMLREAEYALLDLDVDYLQELQSECYTPLKNAKPGQLCWTAQLLKLIRKTKPPLITISEAKVSAMQEPKSNFLTLIGCLSNLGYKIKYKRIFTSDEEAERLIKVYQQFYEEVQKPLEKKQRKERDFLDKEARERHHKELKEATKRYFSQRSLAYEKL